MNVFYAAMRFHHIFQGCGSGKLRDGNMTPLQKESPLDSIVLK
jgi:hypothetical protein